MMPCQSSNRHWVKRKRHLTRRTGKSSQALFSVETFRHFQVCCSSGNTHASSSISEPGSKSSKTNLIQPLTYDLTPQRSIKDALAVQWMWWNLPYGSTPCWPSWLLKAVTSERSAARTAKHWLDDAKEKMNSFKVTGAGQDDICHHVHKQYAVMMIWQRRDNTTWHWAEGHFGLHFIQLANDPYSKSCTRRILMDASTILLKSILRFSHSHCATN